MKLPINNVETLIKLEANLNEDEFRLIFIEFISLLCGKTAILKSNKVPFVRNDMQLNWEYARQRHQKIG